MGADCEQEFAKYCPSTTNAEESFVCAKKHMARLSPECQGQLEQSLNMYSSLKRECEDDLKKYCGIGFQELGGAQKEKRAQCVVENWSKLDKECQQALTEEVPYLGLLQQSADAQEEIRFGTDYKMKKLSGSSKKVKMVYEKNGTVWYIADLIKKNIVEEYEFCPEVKQSGTKSFTNFRGPVCFYEILATWKKQLITELAHEELLDDISDEGLWNRNIRRTKSEIEKILEKYDSNCPDGFSIEFFNYGKEQEVYCNRKQWFDCLGGWYRTSPKKDGDFFGCRLYTSCEQSNPKSYEIGDPQYCAVCQSGGCIDQSKTETDWSNIKIGYCKVSEANPQQTSGCNE